jgi:peroxiredoxin
LGDPTGKFTEALDLSFDSAAIFGNNRSKRYALLVEDGKVKEAFVEPDNTGVNGKQSRNWIVGVIAERIIKLTLFEISLGCREGARLN